MKISNVSPVPQQVGIVRPDGRRGTVRIMARVRQLALEPGTVVDPRWEAVNPGKIVKISEPTDVVQSAPPAVAAVTVSTAPTPVATVSPVTTVVTAAAPVAPGTTST